MDMIKICTLGIVSVLLALQFKREKTEYGIYICIAVSVILFAYAVTGFADIMKILETMKVYISGNQGYLSVLIKIVGITYIAEFSSNICKDAGYQTLAGQIEVFGKLSILALSLPILTALIETISGFLS